VLVLTGAGDVFSAGGDLKAFKESKPLEHLDKVAPVLELVKKFFSVRFPTIARVQGHALGGGAGLVSLCDFAIASENAELGYPEINMGIIPAAVAVVLARTVPRRVAVDLLFRARRIDASEAARLQVINEAVAPNKLDETVNALAMELAGKSGPALRALKSLYYAQQDESLERAIEHGLDKFAALTSGEDVQEGLASFFEKRKPDWPSSRKK
jgi:methylglutaconyl-CoA hydratase